MSADMPPVFVISLARATTRREKMRARLDKLEVPYEIVDAVDGATLTDADYGGNILRRDKFRRRYGREINNGEIGCYLSHYRLWQRIVDERIPSALVLEDDADWDEDLPFVAFEVDNLDWAWGVVLLSAHRPKKRGRVLKTVGDNRRLVLYDRRMGTTAGYIISQWGAQTLLKHCREIIAPIDMLYGEWWRSKTPYYIVVPPVVRQVEPDSLIKRKHKKAPLAERVMASLWRKYDRWHYRLHYWQTSARKERGEL